MKTLNNTPFKKKYITNSGDSRGLLAFFLKYCCSGHEPKNSKEIN